MRLVKDGNVFVTDNENIIPAFLEAGWVEEEAPVKEAPKKPTTKKSTK